MLLESGQILHTVFNLPEWLTWLIAVQLLYSVYLPSDNVSNFSHLAN